MEKTSSQPLTPFPPPSLPNTHLPDQFLSYFVHSPIHARHSRSSTNIRPLPYVPHVHVHVFVFGIHSHIYTHSFIRPIRLSHEKGKGKGRSIEDREAERSRTESEWLGVANQARFLELDPYRGRGTTEGRGRGKAPFHCRNGLRQFDSSSTQPTPGPPPRISPGSTISGSLPYTALCSVLFCSDPIPVPSVQSRN